MSMVSLPRISSNPTSFELDDHLADEVMNNFLNLAEIPRMFWQHPSILTLPRCAITNNPIRYVVRANHTSEVFYERAAIEEWLRNTPHTNPSGWPSDLPFHQDNVIAAPLQQRLIDAAVASINEELNGGSSEVAPPSIEEENERLRRQVAQQQIMIQNLQDQERARELNRNPAHRVRTFTHLNQAPTSTSTSTFNGFNVSVNIPARQQGPPVAVTATPQATTSQTTRNLLIGGGVAVGVGLTLWALSGKKEKKQEEANQEDKIT